MPSLLSDKAPDYTTFLRDTEAKKSVKYVYQCSNPFINVIVHVNVIDSIICIVQDTVYEKRTACRFGAHRPEPLAHLDLNREKKRFLLLPSPLSDPAPLRPDLSDATALRMDRASS